MDNNKTQMLSPSIPLANEQAEKAVLAVYYYYPDTPSSLLKSEDFYNLTYRSIFTCIAAIQSNNKIPTVAELIEYIKGFPSTNGLPKPTYVDIQSLGDGITESIAVDSFRDNIAILKEYALKRKLRLILVKGIYSLEDGGITSGHEVLQELVHQADQIENSSLNEFASDLEPITEAEVKVRLQNEGEELHTGYYFRASDDDQKELLIPDRAITFVVAPTSHGKSTMLENLALRIIGRQPDKKVLYLTYEESQTAVLTSFLSVYCAYNNAVPCKGKVKSAIKNDLKGNSRYISNEQSNAYNKAKEGFFQLLKEKSLNVRYKDYDTDKLISYIKYMKSQKACDVVLIDYTQLLSLPNNGRLSRQEQLKQICLKLKDLAVNEKYGLPIILAAQFNRQVVSPLEMLSTNIGEAGDIERVANTIVAMWNCNFTNFVAHSSDQLEKEFTGLGKKDPTKIYAKIIKRRGQQPNVSTMLDFDGMTGLISGGEKEPQIHNEEGSIPF